MKRFLLMTLAFVTLALTSFGQKTHSIKVSPVSYSAGVVASLPVGALAKTAKFGYGFNLQGETNYKKLNYLASAGFTLYDMKTGTNAGFLPLRVGIKYNVLGTLYGGAVGGATLVTEAKTFFSAGTTSYYSYGPILGAKFNRFAVEGKYDIVLRNGGNYLNSVSLGTSYSF